MNVAAPATDDLLYSVTDGIARVTFNRPQARNAMTFAMYEQLAAICEQANADRSIKVIILTGAGDKAFASGTDISQFRAFKTAQDALDYEARIDRVFGTLESCRVPTIAAIAGACTGGGAGIAACCDMRIGTATTRIGFPIARTLGNCLSMSNISRRAPRISSSPRGSSKRRRRWRSACSTRWFRTSRRCSAAPTRRPTCSPVMRL
jgi:enoyl-CoA hydratase/carnithine racemase